MTREEAIAYFKRHIDLYCVTGICREAEEIAIKALEQEPFKPMVEIDLDYVIKQKYIEREVLDKLRAEIETKYGRCTLVEYFVQYDGICTGRKDIGDIADILQIIDKYKTESEDKE